jgi:phosphoribosylglycinamide formyltransferase 1
MKIAVFASGSGSNFAAIMQAIRQDQLPNVEVALLVCDRPEAYVLKRAEEFQVPIFSFQAKDYRDKAEFEGEIIEELQNRSVEIIVLAGYMRLIGKTLLDAYGGRMINLHPSLLPAFSGKDAIGQALDYGVKITGVTVHLVDEGMDTGPIIVQHPIIIETGDTKDTLTKKIQVQEHRLLPLVIQWFADGRITFDGRKVFIDQ